jgi:hypothetical protein
MAHMASCGTLHTAGSASCLLSVFVYTARKRRRRKKKTVGWWVGSSMLGTSVCGIVFRRPLHAMQFATCNMQHATCNMHQETLNPNQNQTQNQNQNQNAGLACGLVGRCMILCTFAIDLNQATPTPQISPAEPECNASCFDC